MQIKAPLLPKPVTRAPFKDDDLSAPSDLLKVICRLDPKPDIVWKDKFEELSRDGVGGARVSEDGVIYLTASAESVEGVVGAVDARIKKTNDWYFDVFIAEQKQKDTAEKDKAAERKASLEKVRDRLRGK